MKVYFLAVAAVFMMSSLQAQNVNIGIKGGLNTYTLSSDIDNGLDSKIGFHLGLLGHIHITDQFGLQPELVFSLQGARNKDADVNLNLGYLNVPVMFQYMFDNGFRLEAGPQIGFLINAKSKDGSNEVDVKDDFKSVDFGVGLGVSYVHPPTSFGVGARYNLGVSDISEAGFNTSNRGLQLSVFYLFKHRS